ncbi:MAG: tRNA (adenosine(37)-N6)-dimethylallyltransferase MiaA, partial [Actinomycetota bacterium]|nr:tRNA (adenosine(37)-N6)-dimethylallyltransferase MiaA [Actinomycetota bacterium]
IGTAKPSPDDRAAVVHHGLDLCEPSERFTVADYQRRVAPPITDVPGVSLAVAGTGLYLSALVDDLELPAEWIDVRARLEVEADDDLGAMHGRLQRLDPVAAARMEPTNRRRIVRALEVCEGAGRPFSSFGPGLDRYPVRGCAMIGLRWQRPVLAERIEARVQRMLADGLVEEVAGLLAEPAGLSHTARQALGYKELIDHLEGGATLDPVVERIVTRTRQFAVRQERWYRRDPRIAWIDITSDAVHEAAPVVIEAVRAAAGAHAPAGGSEE